MPDTEFAGIGDDWTPPVPPPWADYLNDAHGIETKPGNVMPRDASEPGPPRWNSNGVLYLAEVLMLLQARGRMRELRIDAVAIVHRLRADVAVPGLYHRGWHDRAVPPAERQEQSHDNITGICALAAMTGWSWARDVTSYGLRHGYVFRNSTKRPWWWYWMTPGNWGVWAALGDCHAWLQVAAYPFAVIAWWLVCRRQWGDVGTRLLRVVALWPLREHWLYGRLWRTVRDRLVVEYEWDGATWVEELFRLYFKDDLHPCRVLAERVQL